MLSNNNKDEYSNSNGNSRVIQEQSTSVDVIKK
jgi:hypothetical protein